MNAPAMRQGAKLNRGSDHGKELWGPRFTDDFVTVNLQNRERGLTVLWARYLAEFDFRYSNRIALGIDDTSRADLALEGVVGKRLTYRVSSGIGAA